MGLVKFEVEIPNFEKELSINITIRRDGEVFFCTSSPSMENTNTTQGNSVSNFPIESGISIVEDIKPEEHKKKKKTEKLETETKQEISTTKKRGNFMNAEF